MKKKKKALSSPDFIFPYANMAVNPPTILSHCSFLFIFSNRRKNAFPILSNRFTRLSMVVRPEGGGKAR